MEMEHGPSVAVEELAAGDPSEKILKRPIHNIYVSLNGAQKPFAEQLCTELRLENLSLFLPEGEIFDSNMFEACEECIIAVIILAEDYLTSKRSMLELDAFMKVHHSINARLRLFLVFFKLQPGDLTNADNINAWKVKWKEDSRDLTLYVEACMKVLEMLKSLQEFSLHSATVRIWEDIMDTMKDICLQVKILYSLQVPACRRYDLPEITKLVGELLVITQFVGSRPEKLSPMLLI